MDRRRSGLMRRTSALAIVDLPQPDSPTTARQPPARDRERHVVDGAEGARRRGGTRRPGPLRRAGSWVAWRSPCLQTRPPAPAITNEASVETLMLWDRSPPVPTMSTRLDGSASGRGALKALSIIEFTGSPVGAATVSPFMRRATMKPAICASVGVPLEDLPHRRAGLGAREVVATRQPAQHRRPAAHLVRTADRHGRQHGRRPSGRRQPIRTSPPSRRNRCADIAPIRATKAAGAVSHRVAETDAPISRTSVPRKAAEDVPHHVSRNRRTDIAHIRATKATEDVPHRVSRNRRTDGIRREQSTPSFVGRRSGRSARGIGGHDHAAQRGRGVSVGRRAR